MDFQTTTGYGRLLPIATLQWHSDCWGSGLDPLRPFESMRLQSALRYSYFPLFPLKVGHQHGKLGAYIITITTPRDAWVATLNREEFFLDWTMPSRRWHSEDHRCYWRSFCVRQNYRSFGITYPSSATVIRSLGNCLIPHRYSDSIWFSSRPAISCHKLYK